MNSILEERFTLHDLLDVGALREVCEAYCRTFRLGIRLLDDKGEELLALRPENSFCKIIRSSKDGARCAEIERRLLRHPLEGSHLLQIRTHCGMRYALFPLSYQLELIGRAVIGPFREDNTPPQSILNVMKENNSSLSLKEIEAFPSLPPELLKNSLSLLTKILNAFLFINAKRLITMRLHLEAVYASREQIFRQVHLQDSGTKEDKEEIEKFKKMF